MEIEGVQGDPITNLEDWRKFGPPAHEVHWKAGRSAMELARFWVGTDSANTESEGIIKELLGSEFPDLQLTRGFPEAKSQFDRFGGNVRNHDLLIEGINEGERVVIAVEGKADESFGASLEDQLVAANSAVAKNPRSNARNRLEYLTGLFLDRSAEQEANDPETSGIGYQLLTALAGTLAEASDDQVAVFLVHEFETWATDRRNQEENERVYRSFVELMTETPEQ
ncbi:MAG: hypothetical protein KDB57_04320 [Solirubrobacterales bacterium]|nr:hypothetical protein [Solirubrobacterales bacterium]